MADIHTSNKASNNEPVKTIGELIRQAKKRPSDNLATTGTQTVKPKRHHADFDNIEQIFINKPYERAQQELERRRENESPTNGVFIRSVLFVLRLFSYPSW